MLASESTRYANKMNMDCFLKSHCINNCFLRNCEIAITLITTHQCKLHLECIKEETEFWSIWDVVQSVQKFYRKVSNVRCLIHEAVRRFTNRSLEEATVFGVKMIWSLGNSTGTAVETPVKLPSPVHHGTTLNHMLTLCDQETRNHRVSRGSDSSEICKGMYGINTIMIFQFLPHHINFLQL